MRKQKQTKNQKGIRYHNISLIEDKEGHYRQMVILFTKCRDEKVGLMLCCSSYEESYNKVRNVIEPTKASCMKIPSEIDGSILESSNNIDDYQRIAVLPENEHSEAICMSDRHSISQNYDRFYHGTKIQGNENQHNDQYELGQDLDIARKKH